jgi:hypothetical protein
MDTINSAENYKIQIRKIAKNHTHHFILKFTLLCPRTQKNLENDISTKSKPILMPIWIYEAFIASKTYIIGEGISNRLWLDDMPMVISSSEKESYPNATHYP